MRFKVVLSLLMMVLLGSCLPTPQNLSTDSESNPHFQSMSPSYATYSVDPSDSVQTHSVTIIDRASKGYQITWHIDGMIQSLYTGSTSFLFDPGSVSEGTRTVSAYLRDSGGTVLYDSRSWMITVSSANIFDTVSPAANSTIEVMDNFIVGTSNKWTYSGSDIDPGVSLIDATGADYGAATGVTVKFYSDVHGLIGSKDTSTNLALITLSQADAAFKFSESPSTTEYHWLEAKVFDKDVPAQQIGFTQHWIVKLVPESISDIAISATDPITSLPIIIQNGVPVSVAGGWQQLGSDVNPGVAVNQPAGSDSSSGIKYRFYDDKGGDIGDITTTSAGTIRLSDVDPNHKYALADANTAESYTLTVEVSDAYTSKIIDSKSWTLSIVPTTLSASIVGISPTADATITVLNGIRGYGVGTAGEWSTVPCLTVDDAAGSDGFSGVKIFFNAYQNGAKIGGGYLPEKVGYSSYMVSGSPKCLSQIDPDWSYSLADNYTAEGPGDPATHYLEAKVFDCATASTPGDCTTGVQIGATQSWKIYIKPLNSNPSIAVDTVNGPATGAVSTLNELSAFQFAVSASDVESTESSLTVVWQLNGVDLDGTLGAIWAGQATANCNGLASAGYDICSVTVPSYDSAGPIAPAAYTLTAYIHDVPTNSTYEVGYDNTGSEQMSSSVLTWTFTPNEAQTVFTAGTSDALTGNGTTVVTAAGVVTHATTNYISAAAADGTAIDAATEGDTIYFNLAVADPERDNYTVTIEIDADNDGDYADDNLKVVDADVVARTDDDLIDNINYSYRIPETLVDGTGDVRFRVTIVDTPSDGGTAAQTSQAEFTSFEITQANPWPTWDGSPTPLVSASGQTVMVGFPFTIDPGTFTINSYPATDDMVYQWQVKASAAPLDCQFAAGGFSNITGATSKTLVWTPSPAIATQNVCFRLCFGDTDHGEGNPNPNDCTNVNGVAGPWVGTAEATADFLVAADSTTALNSPGVDYSEVVSSSDGTTTYTAYVQGTNLVLMQSVHAGEVVTPGAPATHAIVDLVATSVIPYDISMVRSGTNLFVAYAFDDESTFGGSPVLPMTRVIQLDTADLTTITKTYTINTISGEIGDIGIYGTDWYLPILDVLNGNKVTVAYDPIIDDTTPASLIQLANSNAVMGAMRSVVDAANGYLTLLTQNGTGDWDLLSFDLTTLAGASTASTSDSSIFGNVNISGVQIKRGDSGNNDNLFVAGIDSSTLTDIDVIRYSVLTDLPSDKISGTLSIGANLDSVQLAPSTTTDFELLVAYSKSTGLIHMQKLDTTSAITATSESFNLNLTVEPNTDPLFFMSTMQAAYTAGDAGASAGENQKEVVFITLEDSGSGSINTVIINTEDESISATAEGAAGFHPGYR